MPDNEIYRFQALFGISVKHNKYIFHTSSKQTLIKYLKSILIIIYKLLRFEKAVKFWGGLYSWMPTIVIITVLCPRR